jgi:hypothetical protein
VYRPEDSSLAGTPLERNLGTVLTQEVGFATGRPTSTRASFGGVRCRLRFTRVVRVRYQRVQVNGLLRESVVEEDPVGSQVGAEGTGGLGEWGKSSGEDALEELECGRAEFSDSALKRPLPRVPAETVAP